VASKSVLLEAFAKVVHEVYTVPYPPMGARGVVVPQYYPAPTGGRMSEGQEGGFEKKSDFCKRLLILDFMG